MASSDYKKFDREIKAYVEMKKNVYPAYYCSDITIKSGENEVESIKYGSLFSINNLINMPFEKHKWAILRDNYTKLSGDFNLFSDVWTPYGFLSKYKASSFSDNIKITLTFTNHIDGITILFQENPLKNAIINLHYADGIDILNINNNQNEILYINMSKKEYSKIEIEVTEWNEDSQIWIRSIVLGYAYVYEGAEIIECEIIEQVDKLVREIPYNEMRLTIGNYDGKYDPLNPSGIVDLLTDNSVEFVPYIGIVSEYGAVEYTNMGTYYFDKIDYNQKEITITAYNLLSKFATNDFDDKYTTIYPNIKAHGEFKYGFGAYSSLSDIVYANSDYDIVDGSKSSDYNEMKKYFAPPLTNNLKSAKMLKLIGDYAIGNNCILYVSRTNNTIIQKINKNIEERITKNELLEDLKYINTAKLKKVTIESPVSMSSQSSLSENTLKAGAIIYKGTFKLTKEREMHFIERQTEANTTVHSSNPNVQAILASTSSTKYLGELVLIGNVGEETTITITLDYDTTVYDYSAKENHTLELTSGEEEVNINIDLAFQEGSETGNEILNYYRENYPTYKVEMEYNGNPNIMAGKYIEAESEYGTIPLFVTKHVLKYNGGLSGRIEGVE